MPVTTPFPAQHEDIRSYEKMFSQQMAPAMRACIVGCENVDGLVAVTVAWKVLKKGMKKGERRAVSMAAKTAENWADWRVEWTAVQKAASTAKSWDSSKAGLTVVQKEQVLAMQTLAPQSE